MINSQTILHIIIAILIFNYAFGFILDYLNTTKWDNSLPDELRGIYDEDKYKKSQEYQKVKFRFGILVSSISFVVMMFVLILGGFGYLDNFILQFTENPILKALLFFGIIGFAADILTLPLSVYSTFVIEEKFGFNKTTIKTFIFDKIKGWIVGAIIGGSLLALAVYIFEQTGDLFWIWLFIAFAAFSIFMSMFYSSLIVPLFNKQLPLEEGELKQEIESFAKKTDFKLNNIFSIDGSKRSTKANAYFTGLGSKKRIVLYDTLINKYENSEITAVLAHEIGHYKKKHIQLGLFLSLLQMAFMLFVLSFFIQKDTVISLELAKALGANNTSFHIGIVAFGMLFGPISFVISIFTNILSRKNEYSADKFAAKHKYADELKSALIKLSTDQLSNLKPHPAYVFFNYSHPTLLQRISAIDK